MAHSLSFIHPCPRPLAGLILAPLLRSCYSRDHLVLHASSGAKSTPGLGRPREVEGLGTGWRWDQNLHEAGRTFPRPRGSQALQTS